MKIIQRIYNALACFLLIRELVVRYLTDFGDEAFTLWIVAFFSPLLAYMGFAFYRTWNEKKFRLGDLVVYDALFCIGYVVYMFSLLFVRWLPGGCPPGS